MTTIVTAGVSHAGAGLVEGPLKGYHHQAFAVRLDPSSPLAKDFRWLKLREPRSGVFWYDLRWFPSEDRLLHLLHEQGGAAPVRIPKMGSYRLGDIEMNFLAFIEGTTLDRVPTRAGRVPKRYLVQIEELFQALAAVDVIPFLAEGALPCSCVPAPSVTNSTAFLRSLLHHTRVHAYGAHRAGMGDLLEELGVTDALLAGLEEGLPELWSRRPQLIHGDLHRKNFVVDRKGELWTIDWELALVGDPLYDLATHLHLMRYQPDQEEEMFLRWTRAVGEEASQGAKNDLLHYLDYKRIQSVCTDVMRGAARLVETPSGEQLRSTAALVRQALVAAHEVLGRDKVPPVVAVESAFASWLDRRPGR